MTGFVVFAHGSRRKAANDAVREAAARLSESLPAECAVETAFLELGQPDLPGAVDSLARKGAGRVVVIPYFLTAGRHVDADLPQIVDEITRRRPDIAIEITQPLDGHPALLDILRDRATEALP